MSDLSQIKTIEGEYSGFADTVARSAIAGKVDSSDMSVKIGSSNTNSAAFSFLQGFLCTASGTAPLVQGYQCYGYGSSLAQGQQSSASTMALAQGNSCSAKDTSFAQGWNCSAATGSFAQGNNCSAQNNSIAQGRDNTAKYESQAFGMGNIISEQGMAIGMYNKTSSNAAFVIGNGTNSATSARSDSFIIFKNGSVSAAGKISAAGVELGGGGGGAAYSAGANIDITDNVISGRDWTDDIASATSGLQPSGDYASASDIPETKSLSAGNGIDIAVSNDAVTFSFTGVNVVYTASQPANPDANTLYLIPEA